MLKSAIVDGMSEGLVDGLKQKNLYFCQFPFPFVFYLKTVVGSLQIHCLLINILLFIIIYVSQIAPKQLFQCRELTVLLQLVNSPG